MKILVVDDDENCCQTLTTLLQFVAKIDVISCNDGITALEILKKEAVNILISDMYMPKMTGLELIKQVRNKEEYDKIIIVLLTGGTDVSIVKENADVGINDFLLKPISFHEVMKVINKYV